MYIGAAAGEKHTLWLGGLGQFITIVAVTAYFSGAAGENWDNIRIGGSLMLAGFLWHVLVGLSGLFRRGVSVASDETVAS